MFAQVHIYAHFLTEERADTRISGQFYKLKQISTAWGDLVNQLRCQSKYSCWWNASQNLNQTWNLLKLGGN